MPRNSLLNLFLTVAALPFLSETSSVKNNFHFQKSIVIVKIMIIIIMIIMIMIIIKMIIIIIMIIYSVVLILS